LEYFTQDFKIKFDFDNFLNKMMLENMYQKNYMRFNYVARFKNLIKNIGAKIEELNMDIN
jgi:hypothetical protein